MQFLYNLSWNNGSNLTLPLFAGPPEKDMPPWVTLKVQNTGEKFVENGRWSVSWNYLSYRLTNPVHYYVTHGRTEEDFFYSNMSKTVPGTDRKF